jgi:signal transduction histidine kinase
VACLTLSVISGGTVMLFANLLIQWQLVNVYARPPVIVDISAPDAGEQFRQAKQANNTAADHAAKTIQTITLIGYGAVTLTAAGVCWFVAGRALGPLRRITAVAAALTEQTLAERIAFHGPRDEVKTLADTFDAMLDRLAHAFDGQRLFVANASHELRTPLTVIRTAIDVTMARPQRTETEYRRTLTTIEDAAQRSQNLLDALLRLARTQHRRAGLQPLDLAETTRTVLGTDTDQHPHPHPHRELEPATVMADPVLIALLLRNLIDNAARYNQPDGQIWIRTGTHNNTAFLQVENTGPTISNDQASELVHAFHRGHRAAPGDGLGLGLTIVNAIVHAHHGHLQLDPRPAGGLIATVTLPPESTTTDP